MMVNHKSTIETMINGAALILISLGTTEITKGNFKGYLMILFGILIEFIKYSGRNKKLW